MKTYLAQNQFLSAASLQPVAKAAASSPLSSLSEAAVTPISESTLDPATGVDAAAAPDLTDPPVAAAADHIHEIFHHARKLLAEDNRRAEDFVDWQELEQALEEPLPLFIRDGEHLRRWA